MLNPEILAPTYCANSDIQLMIDSGTLPREHFMLPSVATALDIPNDEMHQEPQIAPRAIFDNESNL